MQIYSLFSIFTHFSLFTFHFSLYLMYFCRNFALHCTSCWLQVSSFILLPSPHLSPLRGAGGVLGSGVRLSLFTFLVASGSKCSLKLKRKILFKILNDNSKYNFKRSAPNPFKSFKSLIFHSSLFTYHYYTHATLSRTTSSSNS